MGVVDAGTIGARSVPDRTIRSSSAGTSSHTRRSSGRVPIAAPNARRPAGAFATRYDLVANSFAHDAACLESDHVLGRNRDLLQRPWILCHAGGALAHLEDPKVTEFESIAVDELIDDGIEEALQDITHDHLGLARILSDSIHQLALRDRSRFLVGHEVKRDGD